MTNCPVTYMLHLLSGKWKFEIIWKLTETPVLRFNELQRLLPGIAATVLSRKLKELEDAGVVEKKVYNQIPPKVEYTLTDFGKEMQPLFDQLAVMGEQLVAES